MGFTEARGLKHFLDMNYIVFAVLVSYGFFCFCFCSNRKEQRIDTNGLSMEAITAAMMKEDLDLWCDADMSSVLCYLRGNKKLRVPEELRSILGMNK